MSRPEKVFVLSRANVWHRASATAPDHAEFACEPKKRHRVVLFLTGKYWPAPVVRGDGTSSCWRCADRSAEK